MAFGDSYTQIKTDIADWLNRSDLSTQVDYFLLGGQNRMYRDLRIRAMETSLSGTISSGVVALPSDYIALKHSYLSSTDPYTPLTRKSPQWIYEHYPTRAADGKPLYIAREGSNFIFGPYPDSGYTVAGIYYARLAALSGTNTTNWFTANAPELLLFASLTMAEPYLKNDPRLDLWESEYQKIVAAIQKEEDDETFSGMDTLAASVGGVTPV